MKTNKLGKILVVALFVMLFVLVLTVSVNAANTDVSTADGLTTALGSAQSGDTVTVTATIEIASDTTISVPEGVTVQGSVSPLFKVTGENATLTVSGAGTISGTGNIIEAAADGVEVLLNGGKLTTTGNDNSGAIVIDQAVDTNTTVEVNGATLTTNVGWAIDFYKNDTAGTGKKVVKMTAGAINAEHVVVFNTNKADLDIDVQLAGGSITAKNTIVFLQLAHSTNKAVVGLSGTTLQTTGTDPVFSIGTASVAKVTMAKGTATLGGRFASVSSTAASAFDIQGGEITSTRDEPNNGLFWISNCTTATTKVTVSGGKITSLKTPLVGIDGSKAVHVETDISGDAEINTNSLINENSGNGRHDVTISGGKIDLVGYVFYDNGGGANNCYMGIAMTGGELTATRIYEGKPANTLIFTMTGGTYNGHAFVEPANGEQLAQIGDSYFPSLQKAIESITDDSTPVTITLLGAHAITETVVINKNVIITGGSADAEIVVTNAITSLTDSCGYNAFQVEAGKSVTFTGYVYYLLCTVFPKTAADKTTTVTFADHVYFDNDRSTYTLRANGTNCTGGKLAVNVQDEAYLRAYHVINVGAAITCEVNVSGGTVDSTHSSAIYIADATYTKITVSDGYFTGVSNAFRPVRTHCDIEVTDGTFDITGHLLHGTDFTGTVTVTGETQVTSCNYAFAIETSSDTAVTSALTDAVTVKKDQTNTMSATPDVVVTVSGNAQITSNGYMFQHNGNLHVKVDIVGAVQMTCGGARFFYMKDHSNSSAVAGEWTVINVGADAQGNAPTLKFAGNFLHFDSVGKDHSYYNLNVSAGTVESTATSGACAFIWAGDANARMIVTVTGGTFRRAEGVSSTGTLSFVGYSSNPVVYVDASAGTFEDLTTFWTDVKLTDTTNWSALTVTAHLHLSGSIRVSGTQTTTFPALFYVKGSSTLNLTIDGGTFTAETHRAIYSANGTCNIVINNATITSKWEVFRSEKSATSSTLTIKKGTFISTSERVLYTNGTTSTVTLGYEGMDNAELTVMTNAASARQVLANHNQTNATYTLVIFGGTYETRETNLIDINQKVGGSITIHDGVFTLTTSVDNYFIDVAGDNSDPKTMDIVINGGTVTDCFGLIHCNACKGILQINGGSFTVSQSQTAATTDIQRGAIWLQASSNDYDCVIKDCEITVVGTGTDQGMFLHVTNGKVDMTIKGTTTKLSATLQDTNLAMFHNPYTPVITVTVEESPEIICTNGPIFGVSGVLTANIKGGTLTGKWLLNANGQANKITANIHDGATVVATDALHTDGTKVESGDMQYKNVINIHGGSVTAPRLYSNNTLMGSFTYIYLKDNATVNGYELTLTDATADLVQVEIEGQADAVLFGSLAAALASDAVKNATGKVTVTLREGDAALGDDTPNVYGDETMEIVGDVEITGENVKMLYNGQGPAFLVKDGASLTLSGSVTWLWGRVSAEANTTVTYTGNVVVDCSTGMHVYESAAAGNATVYIKESAHLIGNYIVNFDGTAGAGTKTVDISGGTLEGNHILVFHTDSIKADVTISGGVIEAKYTVVYLSNTYNATNDNRNSIVISGGEFTTTARDTMITTKANVRTNLTISGGTFNAFYDAINFAGSSIADSEGAEFVASIENATVTAGAALFATSNNNGDGSKTCQASITVTGGTYRLKGSILWTGSAASGNNLTTSMTINSGNFISTATSGNHYFFQSNDAQAVVDSITINGGTFKGETADVTHYGFKNDGYTMVINIYGGTFEDMDHIFWANRKNTTVTIGKENATTFPEFDVTGSIFYAYSAYTNGDVEAPTLTATVWGGTFNAANVLYVSNAEDKIVYKNATVTINGGTFTVTEDVFYSEGGTMFITVTGGDFTVKIPDGEAGWDPEETGGDKDGEAKYQKKYGTTIHWCFANLNNSTGIFTMTGGTVTGAKYGIHVSGRADSTVITEKVNVYQSMDGDGNRTLYQNAAPDFIVVVSGGSITAEFRAISLDGAQNSVVRISGTASLTATVDPVVNGHRHAVVYRENESTTSNTWTVVEMSGGTVTAIGAEHIFGLGPVNNNDRAYMNVNITGGTVCATRTSGTTSVFSNHDWQGVMVTYVTGGTFKNENGGRLNLVYSWAEQQYAYLGGTSVFTQVGKIAYTGRNDNQGVLVRTVIDGATITGNGGGTWRGLFEVDLGGKPTHAPTVDVHIKSGKVTADDCFLATSDGGTINLKISGGEVIAQLAASPNRSNEGVLRSFGDDAKGYSVINLTMTGGTLTYSGAPLFGSKYTTTGNITGGTINGGQLVNMNGGSASHTITIGGTAKVNLTSTVFIDAPDTNSSQTKITLEGGELNATGLFPKNMNGTATVTITGGFYNGAGHVLNEQGVAKIGNTYYASLQKAINAVEGDTPENPVTIELVGVVTVDETVIINKNVIITGNGGNENTPMLVYGTVSAKHYGTLKTFQIMAGKSVTFAGNVRYLNCGFFMTDSTETDETTVTFKDKVDVRPMGESMVSGAIESYSFEILQSSAKGKLTVNIEGDAYLRGTHAVRLESSMDITLNITGGTIYSNMYTAVYVNGGNATVKMSGGTFNGTVTAFQFLNVGTSDVEITGGKFEMTGGQVLLFRQGKHSLTMKNVTVNGPQDLVNVQNGGTLGTAASPALIENVTVTKLTGSFAYFNQGTHFLTVKNTTVSTATTLISVDNETTLGSAAVPVVFENVTATVTNHAFYTNWKATASYIHFKSGTYTNTGAQVLILSRGFNDNITVGVKDGDNDDVSMTTAGGKQLFGVHHELHNAMSVSDRGIYNLTVYSGTFSVKNNNLVDMNRGMSGSITVYGGIFTVTAGSNSIFDIWGEYDLDKNGNTIIVGGTPWADTETGDLIGYNAVDVTVRGGTYTTNGYFINASCYTGVITVENANIVKCNRIINIAGGDNDYTQADGTKTAYVKGSGGAPVISDSIGAWMTANGLTAIKVKDDLSGTPHIVIVINNVTATATNHGISTNGAGNVYIKIDGANTEMNVTNTLLYRNTCADATKAWQVMDIKAGKFTSPYDQMFEFPGGSLDPVDNLFITFNISGGEFVMTNAGTTTNWKGVHMFDFHKAATVAIMNISGGTFRYAPADRSKVTATNYFFLSQSTSHTIKMTGGTIQGFEKAFWCLRGTTNITLGAEGATTFPTIQDSKVLVDTTASSWEGGGCTTNITIWGGEYTVTDYIFYVANGVKRADNSGDLVATLNFTIHSGKYTAKSLVYQEKLNSANKSKIGSAAAPSLIKAGEFTMSGNVICAAYADIYLTIDDGTYRAVRAEGDTSNVADHRILDLEENSGALVLTVNGGDFESDGEFIRTAAATRTLTIKKGKIVANAARAIYMTGSPSSCTIVMGDANNKGNITDLTVQAGSGFQIFPMHIGSKSFTLTIYSGKYTATNGSGLFDINANTPGSITIYGGEFSNTKGSNAGHMFDIGDGNGKKVDVTINGGKFTSGGYFVANNGNSGTITVAGGDITAPHIFVQNGDQPTGGKITGDANKVTVNKTGTMQADGTIVYDSVSELPDVVFIVTGGKIHGTYSVFYTNSPSKIKVDISGSPEIICDGSDTSTGLFHVTKTKGDTMVWTVINISGTPTVKGGNQLMFQQTSISPNSGYTHALNVNITGGTFTQSYNVERTASYLFAAYDGNGIMCLKISDATFKWEDLDEDGNPVAKIGDPRVILAQCERVSAEVTDTTFDGFGILALGNRANGIFNVVLDNVTNQNCTLHNYYTKDDGTKVDEGNNTGLLYTSNATQMMNVVIKGGTLNCSNGPIFGNSGKMNAVVLSGTLNAKSLINMNGGSVDADITITGTADVNLTGYVFIDAPNTATSQTDLLISGGTVDATALFDRNMNGTVSVTITGGYYNGAGHLLNENGFVAYIGEDAENATYCTSLQKAIDAVTGDTKDAPVTITLIGATTITETVVINKNVIITGQGDKEGAPLLVYGAVTATAPSSVDVLATFQIVAGYSVTFAGDVLYHTCGFFMEESAEGQSTAVTFKDTVEVRNVDLSATALKSYAFAARNANAKGTLTVNLEGSAHLTARHCIILTSAGMSYVINIKDNATLTSLQSSAVYGNLGTFDINMSGGVFDGSSNAIKLVGATGSVDVTGGSFSIGDSIIQLDGGSYSSITLKNVANATAKQGLWIVGNANTDKIEVVDCTNMTLTETFIQLTGGTHDELTVKNVTATAGYGINVKSGATLGTDTAPAVLENVTLTVVNMVYVSDWSAGKVVLHVKSGTYETTGTSDGRAFCSRGINDTIIMGEQKSIGKNDLLKVTVNGSFQVFVAHHELNSAGGGNIAANRGTYNLTVYNGTYNTPNAFFDSNRGIGGSVTIHSGSFTSTGHSFDLTGGAYVNDTTTQEPIGYIAIDLTVLGGTFTTGNYFAYATCYTGVIRLENVTVTSCKKLIQLYGGTSHKEGDETVYDTGSGTVPAINDSVSAWLTANGMTTVTVKEGLSGTPHAIVSVNNVKATVTEEALRMQGCGNVYVKIAGDKTEINATSFIMQRNMYLEPADAWQVVDITGGKLTSAGQAGFYFPGGKNAVGTLHIAFNISGGEFIMTKAAVRVGAKPEGGLKEYVEEEQRGVNLFQIFKWAIHGYWNITGGTFTYAPVGVIGEGQAAPRTYFFQGGNNLTELKMTGGTIQGFDTAFWGNYNGKGLLVTLGEENGNSFPTINVTTAIFYTAPHYYETNAGNLTATVWGGEYTVENGYIFYVNGYQHIRVPTDKDGNVVWKSGTMNFNVHGGTFNAKHFLYHYNGNTGTSGKLATIDGDVTINATAQPFYFKDNNAYLMLNSADIEVIANTTVFLAENPMDNLTITINGGTYKALVPESATDADRATTNYYRGFRIFSLQCQNAENRELNVTVNGGTFESDGEFMWVGRWRERNITVKAGTINVHYERFIYITEGGATAKGNIVLGDAENVNVNDKLFVTTHAKKGGTGNQLFVNHNGYFELTVYGGTYVSKAYSFVDLNGGNYVGGKINVLGGDFTVNTHFIDAEGTNTADSDKTIVLDITFSGGTVNAGNQFIHAKAVTGTFTFSGGTVNCVHGFVVQGDQPTTKFTADTDKVTVKTTATKNADGTITYATIEEAPDVIIIVTGGTVTATNTVFHITKNNNVLVNVSGDDTVLTTKGSDKLFWRSNDVKNASRWSVLNVTGTPTFICGNAIMFSMATIESDHSYFNINIAGGNFIMNSTAGGDQYFFYNGDAQGIMSIDISGGTFKWENNTEGALKKGNIHGVAADAYYTNIELANATFEGLDVLIDGKRATGYSNVVIDNCTVDCTSSAFRASGSCIDATVSNSTITAHALTNITGVGAVILTDDGSNTFNVNTVTNPSYVYIVVDEDTYGYGTFEGAVTHAPDGATAYVMGDLTVGATATLDTKLTIAGKGSVNGSVAFITLVDGAELILNGDVTYTGTTNIVKVADTATGTVSVTFGKGNYRVSGSGSGCAVFLDSSLTANTTVNVVDGADIRVGGWGVAFGDNRGSDGSGIKTVNMTGGYINGSHGITFAMGGVQANITVSGGTIETANENFYMDNKQFNAGGQNNVTNLTITGGEFITAGNMIMFTNDSAATITVSNITVDGVNRLVYMNSSATVNTTLSDVTATVKSGVIVAYDNTNKDGKCKGTATVNGGTYTILSDSFVLNDAAALTIKVNRSKVDDQEPVINAKKYIAYTYNSAGATYAVKTDFEITAGVFECGSGMFIYTNTVTGNVTISGGSFNCTLNSSNGTANGPIHADATTTFNISGGSFTSLLAPMFGHSGTLVANLSGGEFYCNYLLNANGTVANETVTISGNAVVNADVAVLTDGTAGSVMYLNIAGGKVVAPLLQTGAFQITSTVTFTGGELTVRDVTMNGNVIGNVNVVLNETTGTYYTTLEEAVLKAADKDVLVLTSNVIVIRETVVVENKSITIKGGTPEAPIKVIGIIDSPDAYGTRIYGTFKLLSNASVTFTGDVEYLETGVIAEGDNITVTFAGNVKFDNARRSDVFNNNNSIAKGDVTVYVTENATLIGNYAVYFTGDNSMTLTDAIKSAYMSGGLIEANHGFLIQYLNGVTGRFELTGGTMNMGSSAIWLDSANVDGKRITVVLDGITIESKGTGLNSEDTELLVDVIVKGNTFIHAGTDASGNGDYCIEVMTKENEKPSTVTIYGGTFITGTGHATIQVTSACANRVNAEEAYATSATIYGGYFKASANATVRASSGGYLYIFGGYFYFDADPTAGGGPVRLGTGTDAEATVGNAYVYGGNFVSKSIGAAINCINDVSKAVVHAAGVNANGGSHLLNSSNSSVDKIYYPDGMAHADGLISMTDGAGVRIIEGSNGLRFVSIVSAEAIAYLESMGATNVKYGTLIAPADVVAQARTFTLADLKAAGLPYLDIEAKDGLVARPGGGYYIRAAITNIKEGNYDREFAAVGYITYTLEVNGEAVTFTVYTSYRDNKNARSIEQVARLALRDGNGYSAAQQAVLEMFAPKTEAPVIDFYLMAGQSNAAGSTQFSDAIASLKPEYTEGYSHIFYSGSSNRARRINVPMKIGYGSAIDSFGAELGMADALSQYYNAETGRYAAIIKYAYGGTRLYDNITGSDGVEGNWMSNTWIERNGCKDEQLSGGLFRGLIAHIASSVADYEAMGYEVNIKSIYWMQGESDISANGKDNLYDDMFKCWVDDVRSNVAEIMGDESYLSLPVLVGEISEYFGSNAGELYHRYNLEFVQMQREIIGSWDNVYVIPQGNVPTVDWPNDNSHWGYHDHLWNGYMTGSKMLELAHGFYTSVSEEDAVAEVWLDDQLLGTYNTLGGAISMAPEGAVVKLLKDIQLYTTLAIGNRNTITLDGCGHKIDFTPKQTTTGNYSALKFFNTDITVKDLHVINHSYTEFDEDGAETNVATYGAVLNFNAKVTWIGGYLEAERHGFVMNNSRCELTIVSGDFKLRDTAINYASIIYTGGSKNADTGAITYVDNLQVTIEGGTFNGGEGKAYVIYTNEYARGSKFVLNGGTFTAGADADYAIKGNSTTCTIIVGEGAVVNGGVDNKGLSQ